MAFYNSTAAMRGAAPQALEILREYYSAEPALLQQPSVSTHSASGDAATGIIGILEVPLKAANE